MFSVEARPPTRSSGRFGEGQTCLQSADAPLDGGVLVAVLLHPDDRAAGLAGDLDHPCLGVELLVGPGRLADSEGRHDIDLDQTEAGATAASSAAFLARFSATSACQNSFAFVVSTSNSNRSTISG